jgi:hypothetical protein
MTVRQIPAYILKVQRRASALFHIYNEETIFIQDNHFARLILDEFGLPYCRKYFTILNHAYPFDNPMRDVQSYAEEIQLELLIAKSMFDAAAKRNPVEILEEARENFNFDNDDHDEAEILPLLGIEYPPTFYHSFLYDIILIRGKRPADAVYSDMLKVDQVRDQLYQFIHYCDSRSAETLSEKLLFFHDFIDERICDLRGIEMSGELDIENMIEEIINPVKDATGADHDVELPF